MAVKHNISGMQHQDKRQQAKTVYTSIYVCIYVYIYTEEILYCEGTEHWNRLPREIVEPSL